MSDEAPLIVPVENQVRELDPKLLLAVVAARRGFASVIGDLREIDLRIASFPRSVYVCKSMTVRNLRVFEILRDLGHEIVSWDEEALVHLPDEIYYSRRLSPRVLRRLSHLFAWGEENAELWRRYPRMPEGLPIHVTGNPRSDLLRRDISPFYREEADEIRKRHGDFILVNTNFNHVNAFYAKQNLFVVDEPGRPPRFGKAGEGMSVEFARALRDQKQAVFEAFQRLIPSLERALPGHTIVVRPHPTENPRVYQAIAARCDRVRVTNEGNVVPWLMAAKALVHNGCTTGAEAYAMGVPAISYRPRIDERIDDGFYRLPHGVSHQARDADAVISMLHEVSAGRLGPASGVEAEALFARHIARLDGPSSCDRIVEVVEAMLGRARSLPRPPALGRAAGWSRANGRRLLKRALVHVPGFRERPRFYRHRYPALPLETVSAKVARFERLLGPGRPVRVSELSDGIFRVGP